MRNLQAIRGVVLSLWSLLPKICVLAAAPVSRCRGPLLALCALAILPGCGSRAQDPVWQSLRSVVTPDATAGTTIAEQQAQIRAAVAASDYRGALLMVTLPQRQAVATMAPVPARDGVEIWADASGITITLRHGVVIATRGTGFDLMASDMSARIAALSAQDTRSYEVVTRWLDPEGLLRVERTQCTMRASGTGRRETCEAAPGLENWYATQPGRASRQWLGPQIGPIHLERLQ